MTRHHLATNQGVQDRLIEEVKHVLKGQPIQHEHIKEVGWHESFLQYTASDRIKS